VTTGSSNDVVVGGDDTDSCTGGTLCLWGVPRGVDTADTFLALPEQTNWGKTAESEYRL